MIIKIVVEITPNYNFRWKYSEELNSFVEKECITMYSRDHFFKGIYGWVVGYGQPPQPHSDVLIITNKKASLGEIISGKIIGAFIRCDGDHKILCVEPDREIEDFDELPEDEKKMLKAIYPGKYPGDAWVGQALAIKILGNHDRSINWLNDN